MESVVTLKDYGEIILDIKTIMDKKGITITQMGKRTGVHHRIIKKYYNGLMIRYDKDILAKFCFVLQCNLEDIMIYKRPENNKM